MTAQSQPSQSRAGLMYTLAQILALSASVISAYLWLSIPSLNQFSLQAFVACILIYFILKKINQSHVWELLPSTAVDEMILVTFSFLIMIGATGATSSIFFPLTYILLFFLSMTMRLSTAIIITLEIILFHFALNSSFSQTNLAHLISLPIVMVFFLFAKYQYDQAKRNQTLVEIESSEINTYQIFLEEKTSQLQDLKQSDPSPYLASFFQDFLQPKIEQLSELVEFRQNKDTVKGQLTLINIEIEKILRWLKPRTKPHN